MPLNLNDSLVEMGFVFIKSDSMVPIDLPREIGQLGAFVGNQKVSDLLPCGGELSAEQLSRTQDQYKEVLKASVCIDDESGVIRLYEGATDDI